METTKEIPSELLAAVCKSARIDLGLVRGLRAVTKKIEK